MGSLIFYSIMQVSYVHILLVLTRGIISTYWNRIWHLHLVPTVIQSANMNRKKMHFLLSQPFQCSYLMTPFIVAISVYVLN